MKREPCTPLFNMIHNEVKSQERGWYAMTHDRSRHSGHDSGISVDLVFGLILPL